MGHFYVWHWKRWKRWIAVMLFSMCAATFLWFGQGGSFSVFLNQTPAALAKGNKSEKAAALTFNISWGEKRADDILDKLKEKNVQATFFISGEWAERHPDTVKRILDEKHELGMMGYSYKSYLEQEIDEVRADLNKAKETFAKLNLENITLLRPPNGHFNKEIIKLAEDMGFTVVHWSLNPNDWKNPGTDVLIDEVMSKTSNGDIVLLHASDSARQTADALNTILPGLKNKGLRLIVISEMIRQAEAKSALVD
ncbi:polysaccharide deacetylase family sporulation protein PdaB [Aciduricibacillus chroicocephali]|uniref:Polysaccharide deacetylase family sporulation protein PdaB n=1 Tax=Aciduricibacillus chroicocephali TaxID=3054939 RepID=A0ABY9KVP1_9BACI|nr:polysaccharide deacetylase family sporulation protein PdaB [Bacillaceae bacterium 44XB]